MARFKNQVSKGIEQKSNAENQKPETRKDEILPLQINRAGSAAYSDSDMEAVNVAGFKVPYVVREHWKKACREKRVKLSPMLKEYLTNEFGLPPGISLEDL